MRNILLILLICIFLPSVSYAEKHELTDLHIHTYIHEDGSATITERRQADLSKGTENFIVIENIGKSKITDFQVEDKKGLLRPVFEHVDDWDIKASRAEKLGKKSIMKTDKGYELVWGIGLYGEHHYIIEYKITDFIKQVEDAQILYWYFVSPNTNIPPQNVRIEIEAEKELSFDEEKIWAYGFEGEIEFKNGKVFARSKEPFAKSDYAVVLVKFQEDEFATTDILDQTFAEIKKEADEEEEGIGWFYTILLLMLGTAFIIFYRYLIVKSVQTVFRGFYKLKKWKKAPVKFAGQYVEELPYDGKFYEMYGLLTKSKISNLDHLMAAYILKWIKEERIKLTETWREGLFRRKKAMAIQVLRDDNFENEFESRNFLNLSRVADEDGMVDLKKLKKSITKNGRKIKEWEQELKKASQEKLLEKGYLKKRERFSIGRFKLDAYEKTEEGEELERNIFKFMNYLRDYSKQDEPEKNSPAVLEEFIVWAALLGIAKEAQAQFSFVYDDFDEYIRLYPIGAMNVIVDISDTMAFESGAGGSSSGGGGGGAFGGGGGGTR